MIPRFAAVFLLSLPLLLFLPGCGDVPPRIEENVQTDMHAEPVAFLTDPDAGLEAAGNAGKPALFFFSVADHPASQRMLNTVFCSGEVKRVAERFVCIRVDAFQYAAYCESAGVSNFPTIILHNAFGVEAVRLAGTQTADQLAVQMQAILQSTALRPQISVQK